MTRRWKLTVEYDGTDFVGWQRQESDPSIQAAIEKAVHDFCGETVTIHVAGRTDAGVHAVGQVAHVDLEKDTNEKTVRDAINAHLRPLPIAIVKAEPVSDEFHARFKALNRVYCYKILMDRMAPPTLESRMSGTSAGSWMSRLCIKRRNISSAGMIFLVFAPPPVRPIHRFAPSTVVM